MRKKCIFDEEICCTTFFIIYIFSQQWGAYEMIATSHIETLMNQRGIKRSLVELVLTYGRCEQDKYVLDRREADRRLAELEREKSLLLKARDKGGVVVVAERNTLITAYGRY